MNNRFSVMTEDEFCTKELKGFYNCADTSESSHKNKELKRNAVLMKRTGYCSLKNEFNKISDKICRSDSNVTNCTLIGRDTGSDLLDADGIVIIGDDIKDLDKSQSNVLFIGDRVAIGETLMGHKINLKDVIEKYIINNGDTDGTNRT